MATQMSDFYMFVDFLFDNEPENSLITNNTCTINVELLGEMIYSLLPRQEKPRFKEYVSHLLPLCNAGDFREHFRVSRTVIATLEEKLAPSLSSHHNGGRAAIDVRTKILTAVYYIGSTDPIRKIANQFGLSEYSVSKFRDEFTDALTQHTKELIKWPQGVAAATVATAFRAKRNIPGVIGLIDGTHIKIRPPEVNPEDYYNRKSFHSVILQAVCDHERMFTDVYVGWPGSVHDARVFRRSPLAEQLPLMCQQDEHILGDAAYPLSESVIIPFRDDGNLTHDKKAFNFAHSSTRMAIEHCFGMLKGRWRRLKFIDIVSVQAICKVVHTACLLHNLCQMDEDDLEQFLTDDEIVPENMIQIFPNTENGIAKRNMLMAQL